MRESVPKINFQERKAGALMTTHWSLVLNVREGSPKEKDRAISELCRTYWYPLYVFIRRRGESAHDAQDITQGFLLHFLKHRRFESAKPERGRMRTYLLASLKNYMIDERIRTSAQKRGGGINAISIDGEEAEGRFLQEPVTHSDPDAMFDRKWAKTVLESALFNLKEEVAASGKTDLYDSLKGYLWGDEAIPYESLVHKLNLKRNALQVAVHRLRQKFRSHLREVITQTLLKSEDVDDEIRYLIKVLQS